MDATDTSRTSAKQAGVAVDMWKREHFRTCARELLEINPTPGDDPNAGAFLYRSSRQLLQELERCPSWKEKEDQLRRWESLDKFTRCVLGDSLRCVLRCDLDNIARRKISARYACADSFVTEFLLPLLHRDCTGRLQLIRRLDDRGRYFPGKQETFSTVAEAVLESQTIEKMAAIARKAARKRILAVGGHFKACAKIPHQVPFGSEGCGSRDNAHAATALVCPDDALGTLIGATEKTTALQALDYTAHTYSDAWETFPN